MWNAFRFIQEHISLFDAKPSIEGNFGVINEWLLHQASYTFDQYKRHLEQNEFTGSLAAIDQFFWNDFCDNYLELVKDQLFHPELYDMNQVKATRWVLYHVGLRILQWYAPYVPYITDAIYQEIYKKYEGDLSIHQSKFATTQIEYDFKKSSAVMKSVIGVIGHIRRLKTEKQLSLKTPLANLLIVDEKNIHLDDIASQELLIKG
ncbi:hypothetical protein Noda2021_11980 [Candidatus Dependentiae bacterium Noda2021]|nr:hypothetical protein Noda2021_11980 [Candidatus Dependentiae bacterium Noda2021]